MGDTLSPLATLEELIQHVKDVLPELGDDFIKVHMGSWESVHGYLRHDSYMHCTLYRTWIHVHVQCIE